MMHLEVENVGEENNDPIERNNDADRGGEWMLNHFCKLNRPSCKMNLVVN